MAIKIDLLYTFNLFIFTMLYNNHRHHAYLCLCSALYINNNYDYFHQAPFYHKIL